MKLAIYKYRRDFVAIVILALISAFVASVILPNERFRFPWEASPFVLKADISTAQAVTPGQGQTVRVSGIQIGDLSAVSLKDGHAVITLNIDPKYKRLIHTDATGLLRPRTGLKDMFLEVNPGSHSAPVAQQNWSIPVQNNLPDVNPDEIFSALDADTRDYLELLINGAGQGLKGRGGDLQEVFRRFEPTTRDIARVSSVVATRASYLRRVITSLNVVNGELASKHGDLSSLVDSSAAVFRAFASEDQSITRAVSDLPATLRQTTQTLGKVKTFADVLGPTSDQLRPTARALNAANLAVRPFARETTPIIRSQIRPFVRDARPLVRSLRPASINLARATPNLTGSFVVLNHFFNMLGFDPNPSRAPVDGTKPASNLFWLAWAAHEGTNLFSSADNGGPLRPVALGMTCQAIHNELQNLQSQPGGAALKQLTIFSQNLTPILTTAGVCG